VGINDTIENVVQSGPYLTGLVKMGDLTQPPHPGKKFIVGNTSTDVVGFNNNLDPFRQDVFNYWSDNPNLFDKSTDFKLRNLPQYHYLDGVQRVMMFYSDTLQTFVHLKKINEIPVSAGSVTEGKIENYAIFIKDFEGANKALVPPEVQQHPSWWGNYLGASFKNRDGTDGYDDHNFFMDIANEEGGNAESFIQRNFVHVKSNYNFYIDGYEETIADEKYVEGLLPNLYTYMTFLEENSKLIWSNFDIENEKQELLNNFYTHLTLNENLSGLAINGLPIKESKFNTGFHVKTSSIARYFDAWTFGIQDLTDTEISTISENYSKVVFSEMNYNEVLKHNPGAKNFPMNVNIKFSSDTKKSFFNILKDTKCSSLMLKYLQHAAAGTSGTDFLSSDGTQVGDKLTLDTWNLEEFLQAAISGDLIGETLPEDMVFFGDIFNEGSVFSSGNKLFSKLYSLALSAKVKTLVKSHQRNYEDLLTGRAAYSETFFYEVDKYSADINGDLETKLQTFILPNDDKKVIEFFDTQVKYNKFYVYRMWAYKIVIGTTYDYSINDSMTNDNTKTGVISITSRPNIKVVKVPYYNTPLGQDEEWSHKTTIVMDDPPLPPEIEIVPIRKEPNHLIINIKDVIGSVYAHPEIIGDNDWLQAAIILQMQINNRLNLTPEEEDDMILLGNEIFYKSDEPSESFEIYRLTKKPTGYEDFDGNMLNQIVGPNNSLKVRLNFNEKNYFTFRAIDNHGKYSNPTEVYEVEIVENSGMVFPVMRTFQINEENKRDFEKHKKLRIISKSGKRFIYIKPSENQVSQPELDEGTEEPESAFDIKNFSLGVAEKSVFQGNRRFKIRLKSKKTGRVLDINTKFTHDHEKIVI